MNQDLFGEGNNGSRSRPAESRAERACEAVCPRSERRGVCKRSVQQAALRRTSKVGTLRLKWKWTIANLDVILYPSVLVGAVKTVLSQSVQQQHACWHLSSRYY